MLVIAFVLMLIALSCLALAMDRHHAQWFGADPSPRRRRGLRLAALLAIAVLLATALASRSPAQALVDGVVAASLAAVLVCAACSWRGLHNANESHLHRSRPASAQPGVTPPPATRRLRRA